MGFLTVIPLWARALMLAAFASALIGFGFLKGNEHAHAADEIVMNAHVQQDQREAGVRAAQAIAARDAAIKAQQAAADETARRLTDQQEASHVHEKQINQARADAADAAGAVARLRQRIAQLAAAGSGGGGPASTDPAAAGIRTPASRIGDVAGQCVGALAQLRDVARRGQLAGDECAARYDALTVPK